MDALALQKTAENTVYPGYRSPQELTWKQDQPIPQNAAGEGLAASGKVRDQQCDEAQHGHAGLGGEGTEAPTAFGGDRMVTRSLALTGAELGAVSGANEAQAEMKKP